MKPLGRKAYGSIPHLPNSRVGPGDHHVSPGQARIATEKPRDKHDFIVVTEKLDGSNVAIAKIGGVIYPLTRSGYVADTSPYRQHHIFAAWVYERQHFWLDALREGEWVSGEWLVQAHGTRYDLMNAVFPSPFVPFDLGRDGSRVLWNEFHCWVDESLSSEGIADARVLHCGHESCSVDKAMSRQDPEYHGAIDPIEGAVWRIERGGVVEFMCKYVRPDKVDGCYLPQISGKDIVWNWEPRFNIETP